MTDLSQALQQVREAQRILVAYYQRVLPLIDRATRERDLVFHRWNPRFSAVASRRRNPFVHWAWDNLPLVEARFEFLSDQGDEREGPYILDLRLITDSLLTFEGRNALRHGPKGPDAGSLVESEQPAETRLEAYVFLPSNPVPPDELRKCRERYPGYPDAVGEELRVDQWADGRYVVAWACRPLIGFMNDDGVAELSRWINVVRDAAMPERFGV